MQQSNLPTDSKERKGIPLARGVLDYFPDALIEVARVSQQGNDQHNPGEPLHWAKEKSTDEADALMRHLIDRGKFDKDGQRHSAKVAWRALALLQRELDAQKLVLCDNYPKVINSDYLPKNPDLGCVCHDALTDRYYKWDGKFWRHVKDRQTLMEEIAEEKQ